MKKTRTIGSKLWFLTVFLLCCIGLVGGISIINSKSLSEKLADTTDVQLPAVRNMTLVDMMHDGIRANVYHAVIVSGSKDEKEIKEVRDESEEFTKNINQYLKSITELPLNSEIKSAVANAKTEIDDYVSSAHQLVDIALSGKVEKAMAGLPPFQEKFERLEKSLDVLGNLIRENAQAAGKQANLAASKAKVSSYIIMMLSLLLGLVFSAYIINSLQKSLKYTIVSLSEESNGVASTAAGLSNTANELTDSATKQASALQETASSLEEITAMVKKTSENSESLEKTAQTSHKSASHGEENTTQMLTAIETIADSNLRIMNQIEEGNQKISEIVKVIGEIGNKTKVINDIVFQTKLLSFNASVEAARAGEHGKGFAVVAEEVGNLAQMSGNAAKEISDMLDSSIRTVNVIVSENTKKIEGLILDGKSKIEFGKEVSKKCKESLSEIVHQSTDVSRLITEITTAIQEQNQGIQEISKALSLLDQNAQNNSSTSRKTLETSGDLLERSEKLRTVVSLLNELAIGNQTPSLSPKDVNPGRTNNVIAIHRDKKPSLKSRSKNSAIKRAVGESFTPSKDDPGFEEV